MVAYYRRADLAWVPIIDIEPLRIALDWLKDRDRPLIQAFTQVVREAAAERRVPPPAWLVGIQAA